MLDMVLLYGKKDMNVWVNSVRKLWTYYTGIFDTKLMRVRMCLTYIDG